MKHWKVVVLGLSGSTLMACGSSPSTTPGPTPTLAGQHVTVTLVDYMIMPMQMNVRSGVTVFDVTNQGQTPHNFTVRNGAGTIVGATQNLNRGQTAELVVTLTAPTYMFLCTQPGHASLGMTGNITVTGGANS